ncbi:MAG: glycosyltransferase [Planctomycetota bacterium]
MVLATHNRKEVVRETLSALRRCELDRSAYEILLVDNASTDGTPEAVQTEVDRLIRLRRNRGSCAKSVAVRHSEAHFVAFLDDDSAPRPGSLSRMLEHFAEDPRLAAAGFAVHLPDGRQEGGALPGVFVGCGVGLRKSALLEVGGLDVGFFMQAEEYDLCFRMVNAGWGVKVFDDLHVEHRKSPLARRSERTTYYDIRNNLRVIERYLPSPARTAYFADCVQRYRWLADREEHQAAHSRGRRAGRVAALVDRIRRRRQPLSAEAFEFFFRWREIETQFRRLREQGVRRVILADLGKNVFAYFRGAAHAGVEIAAVGDDRFAASARAYRGLPILPLDEAFRLSADAIVVANSSPIHAGATYRRASAITDRPVHCWQGLPPTPPKTGIISPTPSGLTDNIVAGNRHAYVAQQAQAG